MTEFYKIEVLSVDGGRVGRTWEQKYYTDYHVAYTNLITKVKEQNVLQRNTKWFNENHLFHDITESEWVKIFCLEDAEIVYYSQQFSIAYLLKKVEFEE